MSSEIAVSKEERSDLRGRVLRAGTMMIAGHLANQIIRFGSNLVLTRLLVPEMFGVMAIVTIVMIGLQMMSDIGIRGNIIQSPRGEERIFLNTAWVVSIIRSSLLYVIALLVSFLLYMAGKNGWISDQVVYANPVLPPVIAVMSLTVLISGFNSTKLIVTERKLHLGRVVALEVFCTSISTPIMILIAVLYPTIWAMVIGGILNRFLFMVLSHMVMLGENNRFEWEKKAFLEIFHFGKWIFIASILGFLVNQGDRILLGGMISSEVLGLYSIAFLIVISIQQVLEKLTGNVLFPAISEVARERKHDLSRVYYKARLRIDFVAMLIAGGLFASGDMIIEILYDDRYLDAGWMMQIMSLSIAGVGYGLAYQCILALGDSRFYSGVVALRLTTLYISTITFYYIFGLPGAIWAISLHRVTGIIASFWYMKMNGLLQIKREFMMVPVAFVGAGIGTIFEYLIRTYIM